MPPARHSHLLHGIGNAQAWIRSGGYRYRTLLKTPDPQTTESLAFAPHQTPMIASPSPHRRVLSGFFAHVRNPDKQIHSATNRPALVERGSVRSDASARSEEARVRPAFLQAFHCNRQVSQHRSRTGLANGGEPRHPKPIAVARFEVAVKLRARSFAPVTRRPRSKPRRIRSCALRGIALKASIRRVRSCDGISMGDIAFASSALKLLGKPID
jgi:hypothetical protein